MPRKNPGPPCHICGKPSHARNLCSTHHMRWLRHGHTEQTRPATWGKAEKHPLYDSWNWTNKGIGRVERWNDFWAFAEDVGERPEGHLLRRYDVKAKFGPDNFYWKEQCMAGRSNEERKDLALRQKIWRKKNPIRIKHYELKRQFGITIADYENMLAVQGGVCAICQGKDKHYSLAVDHCHSTGKIRGLLCSKCNQGIGLFKDSISNLENAIKYLRPRLVKDESGRRADVISIFDVCA